MKLSPLRGKGGFSTRPKLCPFAHKDADDKHEQVTEATLSILRNRLAHDNSTEEYRKDVPVSVANLKICERDAYEQREARELRQRHASDLIDQLLMRIG